MIYPSTGGDNVSLLVVSHSFTSTFSRTLTMMGELHWLPCIYVRLMFSEKVARKSVFTRLNSLEILFQRLLISASSHTLKENVLHARTLLVTIGCGFLLNWLSSYLFYVCRRRNPSNILPLYSVSSSKCPWKLFSKLMWSSYHRFPSEKKKKESIDQVQVQMNSRYDVRTWNEMFEN